MWNFERIRVVFRCGGREYVEEFWERYVGYLSVMIDAIFLGICRELYVVLVE